MSAEPPPRVHLVDDDPTWLRALQRMLRHAGAEVRAFARPDEALDGLAGERPDLMVIDFDLGAGGTGDVLAGRVREALATSCPPLVLVTGQLADVEDDQLAVFDAAYAKSTAIGVLVERLMALAQARAAASSELRRRADAQETETGSG